MAEHRVSRHAIVKRFDSVNFFSFKIFVANTTVADDIRRITNLEAALICVQKGDGHAAGDCCDSGEKPRSHDTSRIAWAKLMARVGEEFPLQCPRCGGDIRLIAFLTDPRPVRKILLHLGEPLQHPPLSPARGPPTDWGELIQVHDDRDTIQASPDELPAIDIHSL